MLTGRGSHRRAGKEKFHIRKSRCQTSEPGESLELKEQKFCQCGKKERKGREGEGRDGEDREGSNSMGAFAVIAPSV